MISSGGLEWFWVLKNTTIHIAYGNYHEVYSFANIGVQDLSFYIFKRSLSGDAKPRTVQVTEAHLNHE